jgi:hypothetical protein
VVEDRPDLAIVSGNLWTRVQERLKVVRAAYGAAGTQQRPRGQAPELYSVVASEGSAHHPRLRSGASRESSRTPPYISRLVG